jgi:DNA-binding CsgD family transcriptional regulator
LHAGASGYLHKTRGVSALTRAIDRVQRGEVVVDVPKPGPARPPARQDDAHRLAAFLTVRERECLELLVEGLDTAGIAAKLGVSAATVRTHVQSLMTKLGVHSRLEAASYAVRYRLLEEEVPRFPFTGTGLVRGQRRRAAHPAIARPATAARLSTTQSAIRRVRSGGVAAKLYESVVSEPFENMARPKLSPLAPAGTGGVAQWAWAQPWLAWKYGLDVQYAQRPDQVR